MALKEGILIVSFGPSDKKHNERLQRLLRDRFRIEHFSFLDFQVQHGKEYKSRVVLSRFINLLSVPMIGILVASQILLSRIGLRKNEACLLAESVQQYFDDNHDLSSIILHLNRTLRKQKVQIKRARQVISSALAYDVDCVLLPEDSNYYASGIIIDGLRKLGVKVGVVDFTVGKKVEFELSRNYLVPDRNSRLYSIFAKVMLDSEARNHWIQTKEFIDCFPGSLESTSLQSLGPRFGSGLADFYLSSDESELNYLKDMAGHDAQFCLIEPVELTLAKMDPSFGMQRNVFGIFLPPNQLTDANVRMRMSSSLSQHYDQLILKLLDEIQVLCEFGEELVVFPHPRTFLSEPDLVKAISADFKISKDFADYLGRMRCALIFSSAVFSPLLAANIKVFNFDLYNYGYAGVFPVGNNDFVEIAKISEIRDYSRSPKPVFIDSDSQKRNIVGFLETYFGL